MSYSDTVLTQTANSVYQFEYVDIVTKNYMARDGNRLFSVMERNGLKRTTVAPEGRGRTWYIDSVVRASAAYPTTGGDLSGITSLKQTGNQLTMEYDETYIRSIVGGYEFRDGTGSPEEIRKFLGVLEKTVMSQAEVVSHTLAAIRFGDGTGYLSGYQGAGQTINAGVTADVLVDNSNRLIPGIQVEKFTAVDVSEGVFRVLFVPNNANGGNATIQLNNETGGNIAITSGGYFAIPNKQNSKGHGFQYMISDGTEAAYDYYPRNTGSNQSIQRTLTTGANSMRGIVIPGGSNPLGTAQLDLALGALGSNATSDQLILDEMGTEIGKRYYIVCSWRQMMSYQQSCRATGRAFDLSVQGVEDNGLRRVAYSGFVFLTNELVPSNVVYIPDLMQFETSFREPQLLSTTDYGVFHRIGAQDNYEQVRVLRDHFLGVNFQSSVKINDVTGFTG